MNILPPNFQLEAPGSVPESETAAEAAALLGDQGITVGLIVSRLPEDVLNVLGIETVLLQQVLGNVIRTPQGL